MKVGATWWWALFLPGSRLKDIWTRWLCKGYNNQTSLTHKPHSRYSWKPRPCVLARCCACSDHAGGHICTTATNYLAVHTPACAASGEPSCPSWRLLGPWHALLTQQQPAPLVEAGQPPSLPSQQLLPGLSCHWALVQAVHHPAHQVGLPRSANDRDSTDRLALCTALGIRAELMCGDLPHTPRLCGTSAIRDLDQPARPGRPGFSIY